MRIEEQTEDAEHETFTVTQTRSHDWMHAVTVAAALAITIGCAGAGAFLLRRPDRQGAGEIVDMLESAEEPSLTETTVPVEEATPTFDAEGGIGRQEDSGGTPPARATTRSSPRSGRCAASAGA